MSIGFLRLYKGVVTSGILLEGTWRSEDSIIKTIGKTAELYREGAAETAVLSIYEIKDELLKSGEIEYLAELCFEKRYEDISITYINHNGEQWLEIEREGGECEIFYRE